MLDRAVRGQRAAASQIVRNVQARGAGTTGARTALTGLKPNAPTARVERQEAR